ncbi:MAG: hypothetical protein A2161_13445 [Candidatus Schekmanbacteria bacterium RBG_13_48_7]|uniref:Uncharacterized protein n=1 Tax=Candidatus Schekmanbacteria bacterium RBG_13_48_7 TaxID=1817878 RepID=A0A1F7RQ80_9BACT|nr:MAG: hypothetical protein A2161_13445 [Candidatus Schekmanbacteria bacterium RBG_13_48_7]
MLENIKSIDTATIDTIKLILTYCVRGERFCDGHWGAVLESGIIVAVLKRHKILMAEFDC